MSAAIAAREEVGMRSVKPGRGPSMMGGIGAVIAIVFGVVWTLSAAQMGAPGFFPLFGVLFILVGVVQAVYNFKNAGSKNRFSAFDITEEGEEPDPLNERFGAEEERTGIRERAPRAIAPIAARRWKRILLIAANAARSCHGKGSRQSGKGQPLWRVLILG